jgi:hypothetical protein
MFEIVVTYRPDFREMALGRYENEWEAAQQARELVLRQPDRVMRA